MAWHLRQARGPLSASRARACPSSSTAAVANRDAGPVPPVVHTQRFPNRCNWRRNCGGCPSCGQSTETGYVSEDQDNVKAKKSGAQNVLQA